MNKTNTPPPCKHSRCCLKGQHTKPYKPFLTYSLQKISAHLLTVQTLSAHEALRYQPLRLMPHAEIMQVNGIMFVEPQKIIMK